MPESGPTLDLLEDWRWQNVREHLKASGFDESVVVQLETFRKAYQTLEKLQRRLKAVSKCVQLWFGHEQQQYFAEHANSAADLIGALTKYLKSSQ